MGRAPCCSKVGLNKGPWTAEEDMLLMKYIEQHGEGNWRALPRAAGLLRCGKSCRLRWINYLRPDLKRGNISEDEENLIILLHGLLGNRWSLIAGRIPGRTDNEIKNYWNTHLSKKLASMRTNPATHKPLGNMLCSRSKQNAFSAEMTGIVQSTKLMESHLVKIDSSDLGSNNTQLHTQPSSLKKGPAHIMPAESLMRHSEQPLQELKLPNIDRFRGDATPRSLQSSTTISSSFMVDSDSDSASHNEKASPGNLSWQLSDNELTSFDEIEPSSGFSSQKSISNHLTFEKAYSPSSDILHKAYYGPSSELVFHNSNHIDHTVHNLFGKGLVLDDFSDSANDTSETARPDTSTETSNAHTLPDLDFLDSLEVDALWDCLSIDPLSSKPPNAETIEGNDSNVDMQEATDSYWQEFFTEIDPGCIWVAEKSHVQPW